MRGAAVASQFYDKKLAAEGAAGAAEAAAAVELASLAAMWTPAVSSQSYDNELAEDDASSREVMQRTAAAVPVPQIRRHLGPRDHQRAERSAAAAAASSAAGIASCEAVLNEASVSKDEVEELSEALAASERRHLEPKKVLEDHLKKAKDRAVVVVSGAEAIADDSPSRNAWPQDAEQLPPLKTLRTSQKTSIEKKMSHRKPFETSSKEVPMQKEPQPPQEHQSLPRLQAARLCSRMQAARSCEAVVNLHRLIMVQTQDM